MPIDLKAVYGSLYKITFDPAAAIKGQTKADRLWLRSPRLQDEPQRPGTTHAGRVVDSSSGPCGRVLDAGAAFYQAVETPSTETRLVLRLIVPIDFGSMNQNSSDNCPENPRGPELTKLS
jgi:hypothetical protein